MYSLIHWNSLLLEIGKLTLTNLITATEIVHRKRTMLKILKILLAHNNKKNQIRELKCIDKVN